MRAWSDSYNSPRPERNSTGLPVSNTQQDKLAPQRSPLTTANSIPTYPLLSLTPRFILTFALFTGFLYKYIYPGPLYKVEHTSIEKIFNVLT